MERLHPTQIKQEGLFIPLEGFDGKRADLMQKLLDGLAKNNLTVEYIDPSPAKLPESTRSMDGLLGIQSAVELDRFMSVREITTNSKNKTYKAINSIHNTALERLQTDNPHIQEYEKPLLYDFCTGQVSASRIGGITDSLDLSIDMDALYGYIAAGAIKDDFVLPNYPHKRPEGYYKGIGSTTKRVLIDFTNSMAKAVQSNRVITLA